MKKQEATEAQENKLVLSKETVKNLSVRTGIKAGVSQVGMNSCRTQ